MSLRQKRQAIQNEKKKISYFDRSFDDRKIRQPDSGCKIKYSQAQSKSVWTLLRTG